MPNCPTFAFLPFSCILKSQTPLKARLAITDRLIDLVIYRLYRLTEKEAQAVEGKQALCLSGACKMT